MSYIVEFIKGSLAGQRYTLEPGVALTIGRSHSNHVRLVEPDVSGRHVAITADNCGSGMLMEVLSSRVTMVNGHVVKMGEQLELPTGAEVQLGMNVRFTVALSGDAVAPSKDATTVPPMQSGAIAPKTTPPGESSAASAQKTIPPAQTPSPTSAHKSEAPRPPTTAAEIDATRAAQTRMASPEEIESLKKVYRDQQRRRMTLWMVCAIGFFVMAISFYVALRPERELEVTWPKDPAGKDDLVKTMKFDNFLYVRWPKLPGNKEDGTKDSGDIHSFLGKDRDVPLHVVISTWTDLEGLKKTHAQAFADWKDSEERKGVMKFIGGGNSGFLNAGTDSGGVRYSYIGFTRTEEAGNEFFGYALFVRHAQKVHVVRVEVQLWAKKSQNIVEQHRCERVLRANIVNNRFVSVIPDAVGEWWEGGAQYRERTTLEEDMAEAKPFCSADILAPANFAKVHFLVKNILIKATLQASETDEPEALADLEKAREESLKLLKNLRKNMAEWYGRQRLAYQQAQLEGDRQGRETMNSIQADSEVIISDEFKQEDCRYRRIRRKEWE